MAQSHWHHGVIGIVAARIMNRYNRPTAIVSSDKNGLFRGSARSVDNFKNTVESFGPEILVNNAGITKDNIFLRMSDDEWLDVINTNLTGTFRVTKLVAKGMLKQKWGRIINISSIYGMMGIPGQANYSA